MIDDRSPCSFSNNNLSPNGKIVEDLPYLLCAISFSWSLYLPEAKTSACIPNEVGACRLHHLPSSRVWVLGKDLAHRQWLPIVSSGRGDARVASCVILRYSRRIYPFMLSWQNWEWQIDIRKKHKNGCDYYPLITPSTEACLT